MLKPEKYISKLYMLLNDRLTDEGIAMFAYGYDPYEVWKKLYKVDIDALVLLIISYSK